MDSFNAVQSKVLPCAFRQFRENMLICAPTGAGKTNIAMLSIMNVLSQYVSPKAGLGLEDKSIDELDISECELNKDGFTCGYIAPMKALVQEVVQSFSLRLKPYGIQVKELSGDQSLSKSAIRETQLIVTTPEKWDIVTRKSGDERANMS